MSSRSAQRAAHDSCSARVPDALTTSVTSRPLARSIAWPRSVMTKRSATHSNRGMRRPGLQECRLADRRDLTRHERLRADEALQFLRYDQSFMLRFLTAGESHGKALVAILEGLPAGLTIDFDAVTTELRRRQTGYGRGRRMAIESDRAEALSGIRHGATTGGPIALLIPNKDWENWQRTMHVEREMPAEASGVDRPPVTRPRPGHADLAGFVKYGHEDMRNVLERASARETAARVAVGAIARQLLAAIGAEIVSHVTTIGGASVVDPLAYTFEQVRALPHDTPLHCADPVVERAMVAEIDRAREAGD